MKKIWKMLVVALVITTSAFGQQRGGQGAPPQGGGQQGPPPIPTEKQIKSMVSDLSKEILLTDAQEAQVLELYTTHFEKVKAKTASGRPDRNEMETLKKEFENDIKEVLTEAQQKLYTSYIKKKRSDRERQ